MNVSIAFELTLNAPMTIARERRARTPETLDYIPGSVFRGALISAWRRRHGEDAVFSRLVDPDRTQFPFLLPGPHGCRPFPKSALWCKRHGAKHGMGDCLIARARAVRRDATASDHDALSHAMKCQEPHCGEDRKPARGFHREGEALPPPIRSMRMNVGISRDTGTAAPHILFGSQCVEPWLRDQEDQWKPVIFTGTGQFHEDDADAILSVTKQPLFIGKGRSRGKGHAMVQAQTRSSNPDRATQIRDRCVQITQQLRLQDRTAFSLDLTTPLIAHDRFGRATTDPAAWLPSGLQTEILDAHLAMETVAGWDMATRLPKDTDLAVSAGSVILASSPIPLDDLVQTLAQAESCGLGARRCEGFGQITINEPFHITSGR